MSERGGQNACYDCKWREVIPGDAHSECRHPRMSDEGLRLLVLLAGCLDEARYAAILKAIGVEFKHTGYSCGWFAWPDNFDPVWLESCTLYEQVKTVVQSKRRG